MPQLRIKIKFDIGDWVYCVTDINQIPMMVVGLVIRPNNLVIYQVSLNGAEVPYYDFELTGDKNVLKSLN